MFTKVSHWLLLAVLSPVAGTLIGAFAVAARGFGGDGWMVVGILTSAALTIGGPIIGLRMAWGLWREGRLEVVRMKTRERLYGKSRMVGSW